MIADVSLLNAKKATHERLPFLFVFLLGRQDSNLRMSAPKADALPLGDAPLHCIIRLNRIKSGAEYTHNITKTQPLTYTVYCDLY